MSEDMALLVDLKRNGGWSCSETMANGKAWPKITIVTPSFNQGEFLEQTICSVLSQGYPNLEYIIMDGGSHDNSVEIIKKYEEHLTFWSSEKDDGQYDAINKGFSHGTGEIQAWLNSDDMYCPWALRTVAEVFSNIPEVDWLTTMLPGGIDCVGNCLEFGKIPGFSRQSFLDGCYLPTRYEAFSFIQQESTFWRRSLWEKACGIDSSVKLAGDFDLWCRFYEFSELFALNSPLAFFRLQEDQKSLGITTYLDEAEHSLDKLRDSLGWKPNVFRGIALKYRLIEIPKLRSLIAKRYGYHGKMIYRNDPRTKNGKWAVKEHSFFNRM